MSHLNRSRRPPSAPLRPYRFPRFERDGFPSGLELWTIPQPETGLIYLELVLAGGAQHDTEKTRGLASLGASLLDEGSERSTALEIADRTEAMGAHLVTTADWNGTYLVVEVARGDLEEGVELLAEVALEAAFPMEEVARLKDRRLAELERRRAEPSFVSARRLAQELYGSRHPYGDSPLGTRATLETLDRARFRNWYDEQVRPSAATLVAVGDFDTTTLRKLVQEHFGSWKAASALPRPNLEVSGDLDRTIVLLDRPEAAQSEVRIGQRGLPRSDARWTSAQVLNTLLGGKFTSRLNLVLREEMGVTYGVHSRFAARHGPGPFTIGSAIATESVGVAVARVLEELSRLQVEAPDAEELSDTQRYIAGTFPYTLQTQAGLAARLEQLAIFGLPVDYYDGLAERIFAVTPKELVETARSALEPERAAIVVAGPREALEPQLAPLGTVLVESF